MLRRVPSRAATGVTQQLTGRSRSVRAMVNLELTKNLNHQIGLRGVQSTFKVGTIGKFFALEKKVPAGFGQKILSTISNVKSVGDVGPTCVVRFRLVCAYQTYA